jgi:NAD+ kinase
MKFAIFGNVRKQALNDVLLLLLQRLNDSGMEYALDDALLPIVADHPELCGPGRIAPREKCLDGAAMLIALGGDGTILAAARTVGTRGIPILGVNLGKLGFLAELAPEELEKALKNIFNRKYAVEERLVLEAQCAQLPGRSMFAVNDIVVNKFRSSRVIDLETDIDGAFAVTYRCDGLIISTPTGSTAYALSNGGPIVTPTSSVLGITPISPHTLSGRPLIVPDTSIVRVIAHAEKDEILLSADGQEEAVLPPPAEITIRKANHTVRLVKRTDRSYFDVLRAKLQWGKDARNTRG